MRIAVLGTGTMGAPIAENLALAGHAVVVWNRTRAKAEAVRGATVADTPADAARGADAVLTMLADGDAVGVEGTGTTSGARHPRVRTRGGTRAMRTDLRRDREKDDLGR